VNVFESTSSLDNRLTSVSVGREDSMCTLRLVRRRFAHGEKCQRCLVSAPRNGTVCVSDLGLRQGLRALRLWKRIQNGYAIWIKPHANTSIVMAREWCLKGDKRVGYGCTRERLASWGRKGETCYIRRGSFELPFYLWKQVYYAFGLL
jgi:hypothetical protein